MEQCTSALVTLVALVVLPGLSQTTTLEPVNRAIVPHTETASRR